MILMTKPKKGPGRPKRPSVPIQIKVSPELAAALERVAEINGHARTLEAVLAIEDWCRRAGHWPPQQEKDE